MGRVRSIVFTGKRERESEERRIIFLVLEQDTRSNRRLELSDTRYCETSSWWRSEMCCWMKENSGNRWDQVPSDVTGTYAISDAFPGPALHWKHRNPIPSDRLIRSITISLWLWYFFFLFFFCGFVFAVSGKFVATERFPDEFSRFRAIFSRDWPRVRFALISAPHFLHLTSCLNTGNCIRIVAK